MRIALIFALSALSLPLRAQNPDKDPLLYTFALPNHAGRLQFEAPTFLIVEASAKSSGSEFGLRGEDKATGIRLLAFLFLYPEEAPLTSEKCRAEILSHDKPHDPALLTLAHPVASIALAQYTKAEISVVRAFVAQGDLCADIEFSSTLPGNPSTPQVKAILESIRFDPSAKANFLELFRYATVLLQHDHPAQAAPIYAKALPLTPPDDPDHKWRRVTTDQAVMAYGMAGDLNQSRALATHAIEQDPDYPLNYYNLACADAEQGNAAAARVHLEQAFARKANILPGESMPDPTNDDSLMKLKTDEPFWTFVQTLQ